MKQRLYFLLVFAPLTLFLTNCKSSSNNITIANYAGDALDLKAVSDAAVKSKDAKDFEKKLNTAGNKLNNLDLDENNKIDYIKVTEINEGEMKGFSLTVEVTKGEEQEICTIQFEKSSNSRSHVQTYGNHHIYGHNHYYYRSTSWDEILMHRYLYSHHRPYRSSYGYGRYPSYFSSNSRPVAQSQYSGFHQNKSYSNDYKKTSQSKTATAFTSPNSKKVASNIKAPLRNPSTSQKSFQKSNPSRSFSSSSSRSSSARFGSSSSSRSGSSFGGGK